MEAKTKKKFDFSRFKQRHIALKIAYFGWDYDGLAYQDSSDNTVEHHIICALIKTCLIESREKCKLNRCGRTDKGVSSYSQVLDLNVRSALIDETITLGLFTPDGYEGPKEIRKESKPEPAELRYLDMLNGVLPDHVRALAWAPVARDFSSRFSCRGRSYSYVFPRGDLCIDSMERAASYLIGTHDFRNLCSFDLKGGVVNHTRTIFSTAVRPIPSETKSDQQYSFYEFVIVGRGFLYHQIRCIMTILFLVARKREKAELVRDMLDINKCPAKPAYCPASPMPLSLFDCKYDIEDLKEWLWDKKTLFDIYKKLKHLWLQYKTKAVMIEQVLSSTECLLTPTLEEGDQTMSTWKDFGLEHDNMSELKYVPILARRRDESFEKKLESFESKAKKLKCEPQDLPAEE